MSRCTVVPPRHWWSQKSVRPLQAGYFTMPPFHDLVEMNSTARKRVNNLRVGRVGFGHVEWPVTKKTATVRAGQ